MKKKGIYTINKRYFLWKEEYRENIKYWVFDTQKGNIYKLNESSFTMLSLFDGEKTIEEILHTLMNIYDVKKEKLESEFMNLFERWRKMGILIKGGKNDKARAKEKTSGKEKARGKENVYSPYI